MATKKKSGYSKGAKELLLKADKILNKNYKTQTRTESMKASGISTKRDRTGPGNRLTSEEVALEREISKVKRKK